jgi:hypothetical protein
MLLSVLGFFLRAKGESGNQFNIGHEVEISSLFNWIKNVLMDSGIGFSGITMT